MKKALEAVENRIAELIKEIDSENMARFLENKYEAIEYIFEY
jgi:hypothetical protein